MAHVYRTRPVNNVTSTHVAPELHLADNIFTVLNEAFPALEDGVAWVVYYWDVVDESFSVKKL